MEHTQAGMTSPLASNMINKYAGMLGFAGIMPSQEAGFYNSSSPSPQSDTQHSPAESRSVNNDDDNMGSPQHNNNDESDSTEMQQLKSRDSSLRRMWDLQYERQTNKSSGNSISASSPSKLESVPLRATSACLERVAV